MNQLEKDQIIEEVDWFAVRSTFIRDEPELAALIDQLSPDSSFTLLKVSYPYGSIIYENGSVHLPVYNENTFPIHHANIPNKIKNQLAYSNLPLGCITNRHGVEIYRELTDRVHSIAFFTCGLNLGPWEFFDPPTPYTISAGARTIQMLPKIADNTFHSRLKTVGVKASAPHSPFEHWHVFKEIARHNHEQSPWYCEVIFFTAKWVEKIRHDPAWLPFKYFILKRVWDHTTHNRNHFIHDGLWESFSRILSTRKIRPTSYVMDMFKNMIYLAQGQKTLTAYSPADNDESAAPINIIMNSYIDIYGLKKHIPTIMLPKHFLAEGNHSPVYYSLQLPTYLDSVPKSRDSASTKQDLNHLIWLKNTFQRELLKGNLAIWDDNLKYLFDNVEFDFFHSDFEADTEIKSTIHLVEEDPRLLYYPKKPNEINAREFAYRSTFVRGCIRLTCKKK